MARPHLSQLLGDKQAGLETAQAKHWERLFSGQFDADYVASIRRIGMAHVRIGLEPRWYIAGYQFLLNELSGIVVRKNRFAPSRLARYIEALNKVVMLDLDYAISTYQTALIEERQRRNDEISSAISSFRGSVDSIMGTLDTNTSRMQETAAALTRIAEQASQEAGSATSASEDTSGNVQSVAAATEQMTTSVNEIANQINGASEIVREAASMTEASSAGSRASGAGRAPDRRSGQSDPGNRRADQPAGPQRHHRGRPRRRGRQGLCRRRPGSEEPRLTDRQGDRGKSHVRCTVSRAQPPHRWNRSGVSRPSWAGSKTSPRASHPRSRSRARQPTRSRPISSAPPRERAPCRTTSPWSAVPSERPANPPKP